MGISILVFQDEVNYAIGTLEALLPNYGIVAQIRSTSLSHYVLDCYRDSVRSATFSLDLASPWHPILTPLIISVWVIPKLALRARKFAGEPLDVFLGQSVFGGIAGIVLRSLGHVRRAVYWSNDWFVPVRERGRISEYLRRLVFVALDRMCYALCDETWDFIGRIQIARQKHWSGIAKIRERGSKVLYPILPPPISASRSDATLLKGIAFLGHLRAGFNLELVMDALKELQTQGFELTLEIIGAGEHEVFLRQYAMRLELENSVHFHGFIPMTDPRVTEIYRQCFCGVMLFRGGPLSFTYYGLTTKVGSYLQHGLPIITCETAAIANELASENAGRIVPEVGGQPLVDAIAALATDRELNAKCRANVVRIANRYANPLRLVEAVNDLTKG